jgi:transcriptional regulator with XRE-family HTH domain
MRLMLKEIRSSRGITQKELADKLGVKLATYRTWEQGSVKLTLENAYNIAIELGCTPNDICGWRDQTKRSNPAEDELVNCFRQSTDQQKDALLIVARNAAGMSKERAERNASGSASA